MAADFAESSHYSWLVTQNRLQYTSTQDKNRGLTDEQSCLLKLHFTQLIFDLLRTSKMRQRIAATAVVYFRRFYLRNSFVKHDPRLVAPGCLYLASKVEESTLQAKPLVQYIKKLRRTWPYDVKHLLDMEMIILAEMDFNLVVFSPYRPLTMFLQHQELLPLKLGPSAWAFCNDLYRTDLPLLYPPHLLAIACIFMAAAAAGVDASGNSNSSTDGSAKVDIRAWAMKLENVDLNQVLHLVMELTKMYEAARPVISEVDANQLLDKLVLDKGALPARSPGAL